MDNVPVYLDEIPDYRFERPCPYCAKSVSRDQDLMLTFFRGNFELVHDSNAQGCYSQMLRWSRGLDVPPPAISAF